MFESTEGLLLTLVTCQVHESPPSTGDPLSMSFDRVKIET